MGTYALHSRHQIPSFWKWVIAVAVCEGAGIISGLLSNEGMQSWFATVDKPAWNPPDWVFGPVWTLLYFMMGTALWLVWKSGADMVAKRKAISIFAVQLFLNFCWSIIFFSFHSPLGALVDILLLFTAILITFVAFLPVSRTAAWLLVPYLLWVTFATVLNYNIWMLN